MTYTEDQLLPISGLQHMAFCPRQCALIHVEQAWEENRFTAEGRVMHDRADQPTVETRPGIRIVRAMTVRSFTHGLMGKCDVVEYTQGDYGEERILPVEYKRGRPKPDARDEVQLCAQALCLEEMHQSKIEKGALYYGKNRRRRDVCFDAGLRSQTIELAKGFRRMLETGTTPSAEYSAKKCDSCSLLEICRPRNTGKSASRYVASMIHLQEEAT